MNLEHGVFRPSTRLDSADIVDALNFGPFPMAIHSSHEASPQHIWYPVGWLSGDGTADKRAAADTIREGSSGIPTPSCFFSSWSRGFGGAGRILHENRPQEEILARDWREHQGATPGLCQWTAPLPPRATSRWCQTRAHRARDDSSLPSPMACSRAPPSTVAPSSSTIQTPTR